MQLFALNEQQRSIYVSQAIKQIDYFCPECKSVVRRRGGAHRQDHFFHVESNRSCRQNGKGMEHVQVQKFLLKHLPTGEGFLEHPFPTIGRIADLFWPKEKIVFEVQCSPISAQEILERNRDYALENVDVVWILHDMRYNKPRLTSAEYTLLSMPHYFSNIDKEGNGIIYDQFFTVFQGKRRSQLPPVPLSGFSPIPIEAQIIKPLFLLKRTIDWKRYFPGDLLHLYLNGRDLEYFTNIEKIEAECVEHHHKGRVPSVELSFFPRLFRSLFQIVLERFCR